MPSCKDKGSVDVHGETSSASSLNGCESGSQIHLNISTSKKVLLSNSGIHGGYHNIITSLPSRLRFLEFASGSGGLVSPAARFRRLAEKRDEVSRSVLCSSSVQGPRRRSKGNFIREFDWSASYETFKKWIRNPMNMALLVWMVCVAISGAILFFVMTGMLDGVLPKKSQRNQWFEVNNQIINALFTLMCLFQHPKRFHHLALLVRWRQDGIPPLRKIYCKDGAYKPHEWCHMMVVIILLHVNCFAQYSLCALNLVYKRSERPAVGVAVCLVIAVAAPAVAGLYCILSPLGREYELEMDEEEPDRILTVSTNQTSHLRAKVTEKRLSFDSKSDQTFLETGPKWRGGLLDVWEDITVAYLSLFCTFCVFGWNMQRLGFGNMYVHIATFLLFCMAPFWIFNLAAVNVDNDNARAALGMTGVVLSLLGLLYGGFWRIQMRKRFNLPPNNSCCGIPEYTDCIQWLCCCWCSLAQEVRTADYYDIVEDKLCRKQMNGTVGTPLSPLWREHGFKEYRSKSSSPSGNSPKVPSILGTEDFPGPRRFSGDHSEEQSRLQVAIIKDEIMKPPVLALIKREDDWNQQT